VARKVELAGVCLGLKEKNFRLRGVPAVSHITSGEGRELQIGRSVESWIQVPVGCRMVSSAHVLVHLGKKEIFVVNRGRNGTTVHEIGYRHAGFGPSSEGHVLGADRMPLNSGAALLCLSKVVWIYLSWEIIDV